MFVCPRETTISFWQICTKQRESAVRPLDKQYFAFKGRQHIQRAQFDAHKLDSTWALALSKIEVQTRSLRKTNYQANRRSDKVMIAAIHNLQLRYPQAVCSRWLRHNYSHRFRKLVHESKNASLRW